MREKKRQKWLAVLLALALCFGLLTPAYAVSWQVTFTGIDTLMIYNPAILEEQTMTTGTMTGQTASAADDINAVGGVAEGKRPSGLRDIGAKLRQKLNLALNRQPSAGIQSAVPSVTEPITAGSTDSFFYFPTSARVDIDEPVSAEFTCLYAGEHCYVWGYEYADREEAAFLGYEFDTKIYPNNTEHFGSARYLEDGEKLNILIYPIYSSLSKPDLDEGITGFFNPLELLTTEEAGGEYAGGHNTGRAIIHLNSAAQAQTPEGETVEFRDIACATAAHEFQHLIAMSSTMAGNGRGEEVLTLMSVWLDESMAKQAEEISYPGEVSRWGYIAEKYNYSWDIGEGQSLYDFTVWYDIGVYGQAFLFSEYLKQQCGADVFSAIHSFWRTAPAQQLTDAHVLTSVLPSSVDSALSGHVTYPASVRSGFSGAEEELLSKLNLAFQMAVVLQEEQGIYSLTESCSEASPSYFGDSTCEIEGGGRILVATADGNSYTVPANADSRLIYVGFKNGELVLHPTTARDYAVKQYEISACAGDAALGTVAVGEGMIIAEPAEGCGFGYPAFTVLSGSAQVEQYGNRFLVYPESNCTVQINFEVKNPVTDVWDGSVADAIPSSGNVYTVTTAAQLAKLAQLVNSGERFEGKTVMLESNLDLNGHQWTPIGIGGGKVFGGVFEGNGYSVSNLSIGSEQSPRTGDCTGLFGYLSGQNSAIRNLELNNAAVFGKKFVGGLVGYCYNGSLPGCRVSGTVCGTDDVGILCGYANETSVTGCGAAGTIVCTGSNGGGLVGRVKGGKPVLRCQANASVGGGDNLGGLIGQIAGGSMLGNGAYLTVSDSFSRSRIRGNGGVGGIVGNASNAVLSNCYWAGTLTSSGMQGSLVGKYSESLALSGCCYDRNGCAAAVSGFSRPGAIALSSSEMKMQSSYYGWDFDLIWALDPDLNGGMPYLREHTPEPEELPRDPSLSVSGLTEENGTAVVDLTVYVPEAAEVKLALAVYQNGQMMGISFVDQTLTAGENTASLTVSIPEGSCTYELFLVSGADYVPMAEQLKFSAGDR